MKLESATEFLMPEDPVVAQEYFNRIDNALRNYELPVGFRPTAVLELWDLYDKITQLALNQALKTE